MYNVFVLSDQFIEFAIHDSPFLPELTLFFDYYLKKFDDSKSTGTVSTDGSSADDKSSISKPDFEASTAVSPVKSWSSGPSFADILKKKESAGTD